MQFEPEVQGFKKIPFLDEEAVDFFSFYFSLLQKPLSQRRSLSMTKVSRLRNKVRYAQKCMQTICAQQTIENIEWFHVHMCSLF